MQETTLTRPDMMDYYDENDKLDYDGFQAAWKAFRDEEMALKFARVANQEYGITGEQWKNTPETVKSAIIHMHSELDDFQIMLENLQDWKDSMPI